ncbi:MAG: HAD-IIIA family hydrolase [Bacteroidota bacterium]
MKAYQYFHLINTFIFDVDGVLTDSTLLIEENGNLLRSMNTRDGFAIKRAIQSGFNVAIITGGKSKGVQIRLEGLGVEDVFLGIQNKRPILEKYIEDKHLDANQVLYMGDDIPDIPPMKLCGTKACPADADHEVVEISDYIAVAKGGHGCVREVIEKVMRFQSKWLL